MGEPVGDVVLVADAVELDAVGELRRALCSRDVGLRVVEPSWMAVPEDLVTLLRAERPRALVDATHPFAPLPYDVAVTAGAAGVANVRLVAEPWRPQPGDRWIEVDDSASAASVLDGMATRVLLSTRAESYAAFGSCADQWFLVRGECAVEDAPLKIVALAERGPVTIERELEILGDHFIDTVVVQNDGERATMATLEAARSLGLTVVSERPPNLPNGVEPSSVADVLALVDASLGV